MRNEKSCGAIILNDNKVLLIEQKSGVYGFPKGHMENTETEVETTLREIKEETNLDIEINDKYRYALSYIQKGIINKEVVYFLAKLKGESNIVKQEKEINNIFWADIEEVENTLSFDNLKEVWGKAYQDIKKNILN